MKLLLPYQTMIVGEAKRCGGKGWLAYDSMFPQEAILMSDCDWSKLNNSLYSVLTFLAQQNGRGRTCSHCLETDHTDLKENDYTCKCQNDGSITQCSSQRPYFGTPSYSKGVAQFVSISSLWSIENWML